jgi:hypothetical protein
MSHPNTASGHLPEEPPPHVTSEILWRQAVRLWREHEQNLDPTPRCAGCGQPWPCSSRRLALLGLNRASR